LSVPPIKHLDRFYIDGEWVNPSSSDVIEAIQPGTEEVFATVPGARAADISRAVSAARAAFDSGPWPRLTHAERAAYLRAIANGLRARNADLAQIWSSEMGILHNQALARGERIPGIYDYYAGLADSFQFVERHVPVGGGYGWIAREPVGVVGAIVPWNAALVAMSWKIAPALLAGCTVVLKSAPEAPVSAYLLAEVAEEVGLPPGVLNFVTAEREASELLVRDPRIDKLSFTGSSQVGKQIAAIGAERVARVNLELGGKNSALILDDYDIEAAAKSLAASSIELTGQVCSALTRVIVSRHRHDALLDAISAEYAKIRVGDQFSDSSDMGPVAMRRQLDHINRLVSEGVAEGATLASGGRRPEGMDKGWFIEPTLLGNVGNDTITARHETFGPVLSVIPVDSEQEQIEVANDSLYGLNSAVFTNDVERAWHFARQIRSGTVGHNAHRNSHAFAFGGFKQSGIGREGGVEGLLPYLETKAIILDEEPSAAPI